MMGIFKKKTIDPRLVRGLKSKFTQAQTDNLKFEPLFSSQEAIANFLAGEAGKLKEKDLDGVVNALNKLKDDFTVEEGSLHRDFTTRMMVREQKKVPKSEDEKLTLAERNRVDALLTAIEDMKKMQAEYESREKLFKSLSKEAAKKLPEEKIVDDKGKLAASLRAGLYKGKNCIHIQLEKEVSDEGLDKICEALSARIDDLRKKGETIDVMTLKGGGVRIQLSVAKKALDKGLKVEFLDSGEEARVKEKLISAGYHYDEQNACFKKSATLEYKQESTEPSESVDSEQIDSSVQPTSPSP